MIKSLLYSLLFVFLFISYSASGQNFKKLDVWLKENTDKMGGRAVLLIYKDGKVIYARSENNMLPRHKLVNKALARKSGKEINLADFTLSTRQPIASCSKWLSAALVMTLVDEGKLSLADTVGKFLPVLSLHGKGNITIGQCLSHTTGIKADPLKESMADMRSFNSMDDAVENIASLPMEGKPGQVYHYSNIGLQIAGAVLEKVSGKSFNTLFLERLAGPLEMKNTDFSATKVALPAGGAQSTPEDYMNFLVMMLNKGMFNNKRVLSEKSIAEMQINRITSAVKVSHIPKEAGDIGYGYGIWVSKNSVKENLSAIVSSPGLFGSYPWINYSKGYGAFLMTYYIRSEGRNERYNEMRELVNEAVK